MRSQIAPTKFITTCSLVLAVACLAVACTDDGGADTGNTGAQSSSTSGGGGQSSALATSTQASSGTPDMSTGDGSTGEFVPSVDCEMLPVLPLEGAMKLPMSTISEDFTFDAEGNMLGVSIETQGLHRTLYDGTSTVIVPDVSSWGRGIRILDNGDYLVVNPGEGLERITPGGSKTRVLSFNDQGNGLALHPNGIVYLTSGNGQLRSFDPDTGDVVVLDDNPLDPNASKGVTFDGIVFSRDYTTLYYNSEYGDIKKLSFSPEGQPVGEPSEFVYIPVQEILDGMAVDECDNLYVAEMRGVVWRVRPDGEMEQVVSIGDAGESLLIAAINFGSGVGGWKSDHLYIMSLFEGVYELDLGVRSKPLPHL